VSSHLKEDFKSVGWLLVSCWAWRIPCKREGNPSCSILGQSHHQFLLGFLSGEGRKVPVQQVQPFRECHFQTADFALTYLTLLWNKIM
jgi:hypothetical protein